MEVCALSGWRESEFLSAKQISEILGVSRTLAYDIIYSLPHIRCKSSVRVRTVVVEKFIRDRERATKR